MPDTTRFPTGCILTCTLCPAKLGLDSLKHSDRQQKSGCLVFDSLGLPPNFFESQKLNTRFTNRGSDLMGATLRLLSIPCNSFS